MPEKRELHPSWEPILEKHQEQVPLHEHRAAVRESVAAHIEQAQAGRSVQAVDDSQQADTSSNGTASLRALKEPQQVAYLGKVALEEGIVKAVRLAEKVGSAYVMDALHDLLVDELSLELEARHKIK